MTDIAQIRKTLTPPQQQALRMAHDDGEELPHRLHASVRNKLVDKHLVFWNSGSYRLTTLGAQVADELAGVPSR